MKYRAARCFMIEGIFRQDKLLLINGFFVMVMMCGFYVLDTGAHRNLYYLSLPFMLALIWRDRMDLKQDIREAGPVLGLGAAFLLFMTLSVLWSSAAEVGRYFEKAKLLPLIAIPMLASLRVFRAKPEWVEIGMAAMVGTAFFSGVYLLARADIFHQDATWRLHGLGRAENPVQCSLLYALAIAGTLTLKKRLRFQSLIGVVFVAVFFFIMIETQSRGPMVALLGSLAGLFFSRAGFRPASNYWLFWAELLCCVV